MLEIHNLHCYFAKGTVNEFHALRGLCLSVADGDFLTVVGSNGAGKSTLFNAICGTAETDDGSIVLDGQSITDWPEHKRARVIGRLFQDPMKGTAPDMTIEENLALANARGSRSALSRAIRAADRALFRDELAAYHMGLENRMKTKVGLLSGGQRQAMTLLMATIAKPKLLLLDEHTAALDPATAQTVMDITQAIVKERRLSTLMITHNLNQALTTGNRTIMMNQGQVLLDVSGSERSHMTIEKLLALYTQKSGEQFAADRALFSAAKAAEC
ncbi:MAG: ATP-binding cassette domain-containing protein [Eubacteriales bacterium]|nr:ATP-binding cassette domain-containing protein [Eubacteriales bacterium]